MRPARHTNAQSATDRRAATKARPPPTHARPRRQQSVPTPRAWRDANSRRKRDLPRCSRLRTVPAAARWRRRVARLCRRAESPLHWQRDRQSPPAGRQRRSSPARNRCNPRRLYRCTRQLLVLEARWYSKSTMLRPAAMPLASNGVNGRIAWRSATPPRSPCSASSTVLHLFCIGSPIGSQSQAAVGGKTSGSPGGELGIDQTALGMAFLRPRVREKYVELAHRGAWQLA